MNIENEITIYPGVGHAFLNENNYDKPGTVSDAWQQTLAFNIINVTFSIFVMKFQKLIG